MTPEDQQVALRWIASRLREWGCPACGGRWITTADRRALFHKCTPPRRRTSWTLPEGQWPSQEERRHEDRMDWARRTLGAEFERVVGDAALRGED